MRWRPLSDVLAHCALCGSDFVSPMDWEEHDRSSWWIRLRCGQCGASRDVVVPNETAKRYELALGRGTDSIRATLTRLDRERMTAEVEAFSTALRLDLLDAADFAS